MSIERTLKERSKTHGPFNRHAAIAQRLKRAMFEEDSYGQLTDEQQEALEMIMHKIARILNGDAMHADHWHDIAGYATLIDNGLQPKEPALLTPTEEAKAKIEEILAARNKPANQSCEVGRPPWSIGGEPK